MEAEEIQGVTPISGEQAARAEEKPTDERSTPCPRCGSGLFEGKHGSASLLGCGRCGGAWVDSSAYAEVVRGAGLAYVALGEQATRAATITAPDGPVHCPVCAAPAIRKQATPAVAIDVCEAHGAWFDANELRIVGLAHADFPPPMKLSKPTSLLLIGWLWLLGGVGWVVSSIVPLVQLLSAPSRLPAEWSEVASSPGAVSFFSSMSHGAATVLTISMLCAALGAACGVGLLRLRDWGRQGLTILTSILILLDAGFLLFVLSLVPFHDAPLFVYVVVAIFAAITIGFGGVLIAMFRALRGPLFRSLMTPRL